MSTIKETITFAKTMFQDCVELLEKKGQDYSGSDDTNKNLMACEHLGYCKAEVGVLTRIQDKLARVHNLMSKEDKDRLVKDETIRDTIRDSINYHVKLLEIIEEKRKPSKIS